MLDRAVSDYCDRATTPESTLLAELARETRAHVHGAQMLSGIQVCALLKLLVQMTQAHRILELGTFTGYSALSMAEVLPHNGELITIERSQATAQLAQFWFDRSEHGHKIQLLTGEIKTLLPVLTGTFDLFFIDADKKAYPDYYEMALTLSHPGSVIVLDNMLRQGKVLAPEDEQAQVLDKLNQFITQDQRVTNVLLSVRDGVQVVRVKE
jgi:caffeoyl-CoA O-methyltransferase